MTIACADCGTIEELSAPPPGSWTLCPVCSRKLERTRGRSIDASLGCALGTFLLLFPANLMPLLSVSVLGVYRSSQLASGIVDLWNEQWVLLAILIGLFAIVLPFLRFGLLSLALGTLHLGRRPSWLGRVFRWALWLDVWAMPDVFLLGAFVGYSRVAANLNVTIMWGGYCFLGAAFLSMLSRASLDRPGTWRAISPNRAMGDREPTLSCLTCHLLAPLASEGTACDRCGARLVSRKTDSTVRTTALILGAFVLYWPANVFPMNVSTQLGQQVSYRIIDGIRDLFQAGLAPFGVLIFFTSIAIPLLKIVVLGWCVLSVTTQSTRHLVFKTKLYRIVDEIGRWSNVDPFTIAVFVPLMQLDSLVSSRGASAATAFILVVTLTLLASAAFDPRLMWDAVQDKPG